MNLGKNQHAELQSAIETEMEKYLVTIKHVRPVDAGSASGLVAEIYAQIKKDFGKVVEPFVLHSLVPKLLAGVWMACRETELAGRVPRHLKEAVAAAVSMTNRCPYCVDAHTIMLNASGEHNVATSISHANYAKIGDAKARFLAQWASTTNAPNTESRSLLSFAPSEVPEIIGTAVFYQYMNRMATVLLSETPLPSNAYWLRSPLRRIAGMMFAGAVRTPKTAGESLRFLPNAELPSDLQWAKPNPTVAQAFARFSATIDETGEQSIPLQVRKHLTMFVSKWQGKPVPPDKHWISSETNQFNESAKSAAQLALLAAVAPWQIDDFTILGFRRYFPEDRMLLGTLAWGSFLAAKRIGTWIQQSST